MDWRQAVVRELTRQAPKISTFVLTGVLFPIVGALVKKVLARIEDEEDKTEGGGAPTDSQAADQPAAPIDRAVRDPNRVIRERLVDVRDAVLDSASRKIDLREYFDVAEAAWELYVGVWGLPGYKTRKQTVVARLSTTIRRL